MHAELYCKLNLHGMKLIFFQIIIGHFMDPLHVAFAVEKKSKGRSSLDDAACVVVDHTRI